MTPAIPHPEIVVLDGFTLNPGDLSWEPLERLGHCTIFDRTRAADILPRAQPAEILFTNKTPLSAETIRQLPALRCIGVLATGYNVVDVAAAKARGIPVCNVPDYGTPNVAQTVFALLLELTNRTAHHAIAVREGRWTSCPDFCFWDGELVELSGLTLGIVGYGKIGRAVAKIGRAFGMRILHHGRSAMAEPARVELARVELAQLFRESDVVSLHCPLTAENAGMVNAAMLALMKPTAYFLNTARGLLVNEADLAKALNEGRIAGAGLDVLSVEPPSASNPLLHAKNCLITPHIAWATQAARRRLLDVAAANAAAFLAGRPQHVVAAP